MSQLTAKKRAQEFQSQCEIGALVRFMHVFLALVFAAGAMICAFTGLHEWDRVFSSGVALLILWEVLAYGYRQWKRLHKAAREYEQIALKIVQPGSALSGLPDPPKPDVGTVVGKLGSLVNDIEWSVKKPSPLKHFGIWFVSRALIVIVVVVLVVVGALCLSHFVPHFRVADDEPPGAGVAK